jgi:phosphohistidine swiveling domain-containing protein
MWVHQLADADASCGGKAMGLGKLLRAGEHVPDGFVIAGDAFRQIAGDVDVTDAAMVGHLLTRAANRIATSELPVQLEREVRERAAALGIVAVRSSATIEDGLAGAAAGVFSSRRGVPAAEVWDAIRDVWTSALTPLAAAYARQRGRAIVIGVIVQRFVEGEHATVYTRPPGAPDVDHVLIQRGEQVTRADRRAADSTVQCALRAEAAIAATCGADVELVGTWIVQARPIVHPVVTPRMPPPPAVIAPLLLDGRCWTLDLAHNPDPLSPAQSGIVERAERAQLAPWSMRVCAGFLYSAPCEEPRTVRRPMTRAALAARVAEIEEAMGRALGAELPPLEEAIERYLAFYRIWATELAPLIAAGRAALLPAQLAGARPSAVEATLIAAARGEFDEAAVIARLGVLAPAWDVAVPTFGERPGLLRAAIARARSVPYAEPVAHDDVATAAADLAERDDVWFARAQLLVRRALLARAAELGISAEDVFWLTLDDVVQAASLDPDDTRRRASAARAAAARAAQWAMPAVVGGRPPPRTPALHGIGTGPRVTGRVVRFASLASAVSVGAGDVVVTRAVTPALAVLVIGCAALVSETGGPLDHGAALARELGIPCVVGCNDAWSLLSDGMLVSVDGDAGAVELIASKPMKSTTNQSSSS